MAKSKKVKRPAPKKQSARTKKGKRTASKVKPKGMLRKATKVLGEVVKGAVSGAVSGAADAAAEQAGVAQPKESKEKGTSTRTSKKSRR